MQNILAVDTSSRVLSIAVRAAGGGLAEINLEGVPRHAEHLVSLIDQGLRELRIKKNEIEHLVWGAGPGSFTGLRISFSILKGLHMGLGKNASAASSLDLIALGSGLVSGKLAVCVDARREKIYLARYTIENGNFIKSAPDSVIAFDDLIADLENDTFVTGDVLSTYVDRFRANVSGEWLMGPDFWYPRAKFGILLHEAGSEWLEPLSLRTMTPRYLRLSEPEEKSNIARSKN